jgi:hypothetical protein
MGNVPLHLLVFWYKWHENLFRDGVRDRKKHNTIDRIIMPHAFIFLLKFVFVSFPCSELNDTVVEAKIRTRQVPPLLPINKAINRYLQSNNRLLILVCTV